MNLLLSDAWAEGPVPAAGAGGGYMNFLFPIAIFVIFYFLLIRPQTKRAKEHKLMAEALAKGDEVVTSGGIIGRISQVGDTYVSVDIAEGVAVKVQRHAISVVLPKGTVKSA